MNIWTIDLQQVSEKILILETNIPYLYTVYLRYGHCLRLSDDCRKIINIDILLMQPAQKHLLQN